MSHQLLAKYTYFLKGAIGINIKFKVKNESYSTRMAKFFKRQTTPNIREDKEQQKLLHCWCQIAS
jgi:hypothetical protein